MKKFPHGTTIEEQNYNDGKAYLICSKNGAMCRYAQHDYVAEEYAKTFEEYYY